MARNLTLRRMRQSSLMRELSRQIEISTSKLIQPLFVVEGIASREVVPGLTSVHRETPDSLLKQVESDLEAGVRKFLLFGIPGKKGTDTFKHDFTAGQITALKKRFGQDILLAVDVCLCSSTAHGHCGILGSEGDYVDNGRTVAELARLGLEYAQAGADCIAPSDMMDGRVGAIRQALDQAGLDRTLIMSYSAKFHSRFYGPFRIAADSAPKGDLKLKDRATYQIDPASPNDAFLSSERDADEGADILMVKPGLPYLDILQDLSRAIPKPWAVYEVSGEYAAVELMAREGLIDGPRAHLEAWTAFIRAGASIIITYGARSAQKWLELK